MNPWILVSAVALCLTAVAAYPYPAYDGPAAADGLAVLHDAEAVEMEAAKEHHGHKGGGGGGGGGGGHGHGKATSYQVSNNWAYHPVKVYIKHHKHHDSAGGSGGAHKDYVF